MIILGIETSCDDTCIALAECSSRAARRTLTRDKHNSSSRQDVASKSAGRFKLISNLVSSQVKIHQKWGGVYPSLARREHQRNLVPLLKKSLKEAGLLNEKQTTESGKSQTKNQNLNKVLKREKILYEQTTKFLRKHQKPNIDIIAVTIGPGLDPCLWTGINFARALAYYWNLPIMGINHIEAHIFANWLKPINPKLNPKGQKTKIQNKNKEIKLPAIALIVSGGHTQIILIKNPGKYKNHASLYSVESCIPHLPEYKILGETRDDAAGEAFDKIARILGLGYPGGPAIATAAAQAAIARNSKLNKFKIALPRPMLYSKNYDFSFSGLKTAVLYDYKKRNQKTKKSKEYIQAMAYNSQQAIIDVLIKKTIRAAKNYKAKSILLGGGVTANRELRKQFEKRIKEKKLDIALIFPPQEFCTDNAAMVSITACFKSSQGHLSESWQKIEARPNLRIKTSKK